jgi:hypothetical protein
MSAEMDGAADPSIHTFRRCSRLRSDFLNCPEIVFTVPAGIALESIQVSDGTIISVGTFGI